MWVALVIQNIVADTVSIVDIAERVVLKRDPRIIGPCVYIVLRFCHHLIE